MLLTYINKATFLRQGLCRLLNAVDIQTNGSRIAGFFTNCISVLGVKQGWYQIV